MVGRKIRFKNIEFVMVESSDTDVFFKSNIKDDIFYESNVLKTIMKYAKEDSIFVDVGAYLGFYTTFFGKLSPKGHVYSFEMNHTTFQDIKNSVKLNEFNHVECFNLGVLNKEQIISIPKKYNYSDLSINTKYDGERVNVKCVSLDEFFKDKQKPNIFKIDVEGAEQFVLEGMKELLKEDLIIILEFHGNQIKRFGHSFKSMITLLKDYKIYEIVNHLDCNINSEPILKEIINIPQSDCWTTKFLILKEDKNG